MTRILLATTWMMLAVSPVACCAQGHGAESNPLAVRLSEAVEVRRDRVWLSDLLPRDASSALRKAASAIALCPAPQPGSARVLDAEHISIKLAEQPKLLRQLAIPPRVTIRFSGWPIAEDAVRIVISKFLRQQGRTRDLPAAARLDWPQSLASVEEYPTLQVVGLDWDNRQESAQVRVRCSARASCGSFMVHVVLPPPLADEWHDRLGSGRGSSFLGGGQADSAGTALAERGKPATLILEAGNMRISVQVICLQRGALSQQIRVFDKQSRRVFHAEVVGENLLHARL